MSSPRRRWPSVTAAAVLVVAGSSAALCVTNPTRDDYQDFAGETLVRDKRGHLFSEYPPPEEIQRSEATFGVVFPISVS